MVSSSSAGVPRMLEDRHNNNTRLTSPDALKANMSDIEEFQGKIVYNPDGSAYIIEDGDFSDEEELPVPMQEGSIVEKPGQLSDVDQFPTIENAIYVARNKSLNNYPAYVRAQTNLSERPTVHSYRVYNYRHKPSDSNNGPIPVETPENIPVKPILMCFICKLSFGNTKSFIGHCKDEHGLEFNEDEREMLKLDNVSALIQQVGKDKAPLLSFLEPVVKGGDQGGLRSPSKSPSEAGGQAATGIRVRNDLAASAAQISPVSNGRSSTSPGVTSLSPSPSSFNTQSAGSYPGKGTTIGACPDHINGRPTGLDCAKCDLIMNTNRLGGLGWNASNNACKTLKCPKCNWHYKYQETLEIHMKEKHPDSDSNCIYCITGQQHPRLARGETYTCGYKPYRCEVCNYSTTTKGNLSIHMQSDKHINNMQELQNGGVVTASDGTKITQNILSKMPAGGLVSQRLAASHPTSPGQNMWRCDICNFETSQPRNLRVHMTSEKHVQNITAIQHNMKQLQGIQLLQNLTNTDRGGGGLPPLPPLPPLPALQQPGEMMMMMELASQASQASQAQHNQNVFLHLLSRQREEAGGELGEQTEAAQAQTDPNPIKLFNCCICREFNTDTLDGLSSHIALDRSVEGEGEVQILLGGTHICKLCSYKTNLKANFQLHCKTDKHLARLSLYNHIREGGPANEWKLSMLTGTNPTQLRCNACDYNTNSLHKLQSHVHTQSHEVSVILFSHLCQAELNLPKEVTSLSYSCSLCKVSSRGKAALLSHARSLLHLRAEQACEARRAEAGGEQRGEQPGLADIFLVTPWDSSQYSDTEQAESSETGELSVIIIIPVLLMAIWH